MGIVEHHAAAKGTLSPELPEELVCKILACLPLNNHKFRLQAVLPTWRNAMYRPESHNALSCEWRFKLPPSLPSRLLRVMPIIQGTLFSSRFKAQGMEHLHEIASFAAENLEHCLPVPGLRVLHCYGGSALPETLGRLSVVFPSLKQLTLEEGAYTHNFLQNDLSKLTQLEVLIFCSSTVSLDSLEKDIPAICAPRLCQITLTMGHLSRQLVPQCTAMNLSSLGVILIPEDDCVVRMTQFSGCVALRCLSYHVLEDPEGDSDGHVTGITVTFTGFNSLPVCLEAIHIEADEPCEVVVAPAVGWASSVQFLCKYHQNVSLTSTRRVH